MSVLAFTDDGDENTTMEATTPISAANSDSAVNVKKGEWRQKAQNLIVRHNAYVEKCLLDESIFFENSFF